MKSSDSLKMIQCFCLHDLFGQLDKEIIVKIKVVDAGLDLQNQAFMPKCRAVCHKKGHSVFLQFTELQMKEVQAAARCSAGV